MRGLRTMLTAIAVVLSCTLALYAGGNQVDTHPLNTQSPEPFPDRNYISFYQYQKTVMNWVRRNRVFLTKNPEQELQMNVPFEVAPSVGPRPSKGILFVHGLGDTPWSFTDLAKEYSQRGYLVRTILLPGHGSRPADLIEVGHEQWEKLLAQQVGLMKEKVEDLSLGGFSTGANLVTTYANQDPDIKNLFLFSPAFESRSNYDFLAPTASFFKDWLFTVNPELQTNSARYTMVPMNAFAQYYKTSVKVKESLEQKPFDRPVFVTVSQHDSVVDVTTVMELFTERFRHPNSRMLWFGDPPETADQRILAISSELPAERISNFSHMAVLHSPENSYYGIDGSFRLCDNGRTDDYYQQCVTAKETWFSAWGYEEPGKIYARLTFNPHFKAMLTHIDQVGQHHPEPVPSTPPHVFSE